ncbi:MAG TPA: 2-C-methyl-D-erythritol 4-phosphate cytidylyltransferase [Firmicutes bacterium]|nr:2-C-methyl-D-erythritol 4-phosphate cytidylyltransferase [Bacillota bacterium]
MLVSCVVPAAGQGRRMGGDTGKLFMNLNGKPVLSYTLEAIEKCPLISEIVLVVKEDEIQHASRLFAEERGFSKVKRIIPGGAERQMSVYLGLLVTDAACDIVMIHDGARPLITLDAITSVINEAAAWGAAVVATPVKDTIKLSDSQGFVKSTLDRSRLWAVQTPQAFRRELLLCAYEKAHNDGFLGTDDSVLVERLGWKVKLVPGSYENIKITTPEDIPLAEAILRRKVLEGRNGI